MKFRFARHSNNIERLKFFYTEVVGLEVLGGFQNHNNYNGVFLGKKNVDWHLEFTESDEVANHEFDEDDVLVFYIDEVEYDKIQNRLKQKSIKTIKPKNSY